MDVQTLIAVAIVAVSAAYLVRRWVLAILGRSRSCHTGCHGCPHNSACPSQTTCQDKERPAAYTSPR